MDPSSFTIQNTSVVEANKVPSGNTLLRPLNYQANESAMTDTVKISIMSAPDPATHDVHSYPIDPKFAHSQHGSAPNFSTSTQKDTGATKVFHRFVEPSSSISQTGVSDFDDLEAPCLINHTSPNSELNQFNSQSNLEKNINIATHHPEASINALSNDANNHHRSNNSDPKSYNFSTHNSKILENQAPSHIQRDAGKEESQDRSEIIDPDSIRRIMNLEELVQKIPPYNVNMSEESFADSLMRFLQLAGLGLKRIPQFAGRTIEMHRLFLIICEIGGIIGVSDRPDGWHLVLTKMGYTLPPRSEHSIDQMALQIKMLSTTLFFAYEQFYLQGVPINQIQWPSRQSQSKNMPKTLPTCENTTKVSVSSDEDQSFYVDRWKIRWDRLRSDKFLTDILSEDETRSRLKGLVIGNDIYSWQELSLMLCCPHSSLHSLALAHLERMSFVLSGPETNLTHPPNAADLNLILSALHAYTLEITENFKTHKIDTLEEIPSLYFLGREERLQIDLINSFSSRKKWIQHRMDSILNILRNLSFCTEIAPIIAASQIYVFILSLASDCYFWKIHAWLIFEQWQNACLIMLQTCIHIDPKRFRDICPFTLSMCAKEIEHILHFTQRPKIYCLLPHISNRLSLSLEVESEKVSTDSIKKAIISLINTANDYWKHCPSHCFLLVDLVGRLASNSELIQKSDPQLKLLMWVIWDLVEAYSGICLTLARLISQLVADSDFSYTNDHIKWIGMVIHNAGFGLPDGGYLEGSLIALDHILPNVSSKDLITPFYNKSNEIPVDKSAESSDYNKDYKTKKPWINIAVCKLISLSEGLRTLWLHKIPPSRQHEHQSPLIMQTAQAMTSQPYQVYLRLVSILNTIFDALPDHTISGVLTSVEEAIALKWLTEEIPTPSCREILQTPNLVKVAERILYVSQSY